VKAKRRAEVFLAYGIDFYIGIFLEFMSEQVAVKKEELKHKNSYREGGDSSLV
jgi:hypothetical protein